MDDSVLIVRFLHTLVFVKVVFEYTTTSLPSSRWKLLVLAKWILYFCHWILLWSLTFNWKNFFSPYWKPFGVFSTLIFHPWKILTLLNQQSFPPPPLCFSSRIFNINKFCWVKYSFCLLKWSVGLNDRVWGNSTLTFFNSALDYLYEVVDPNW